MPESTTICEHPCPECGGDPQITRARLKGISHRSAYIALGLWGFLLVLVMAYSLPWVQDKLGNQLAIYTSASGGAQYEYCNPLTPALSIADLRDDATAAQQVRDVFRPLSTDYGRWWTDTKVRFIFTNPVGMRFDQRNTGFGGIWSSEHANTYLTDVTHEPTGDGPWDYPLEAVDTNAYSQFRSNDRSWLGMRVEQTRLGGGQTYYKSIYLFQFLASVIAVLLIVKLAFLLLWGALAKRGAPPKQHRLIQRAGISVAFVLLLVSGTRNTNEHHYIAGIDLAKVDTSQIGPWMQSEQFEQYLVNPDQTDAMIAYLRELSEDLPGHLILAYQTMREDSSNAITEYTILNAQLRYNAELMSFSRLRFLNSGPNSTTTPGTLPGYLEPGFVFDHAEDWGALWIGYNAASDSRFVSIYWTRLVFAGYIAWIALRMARWLAQRSVFRTQRKRVRRDQCIFCAYPLNEHALQLRRHANPEPKAPSPPTVVDAELI